MKLYQGIISYCCHKPIEGVGVSKGFCCSGCKKEVGSWRNKEIAEKELKNREK